MMMDKRVIILVVLAGAGLFLLVSITLLMGYGYADEISQPAGDPLRSVADFSTSYKSGPSAASTNEMITYTIVAVNTTQPVTGVMLADDLPYTSVYIPGSCTYYTSTGVVHLCSSLDQMWRMDFGTNERATTTFAVRVTAGSMNWPMINCAILSWDTQQERLCVTTVINPPVARVVYLPIVMRNYAPAPAFCVPYLAGIWRSRGRSRSAGIRGPCGGAYRNWGR